MVWDPQQYLKFSGHRLRPAVDLLMRIPDFAVQSIADLGAGAGNVTKLIKERWPEAAVMNLPAALTVQAAADEGNVSQPPDRSQLTDGIDEND